MVNKLFSKGKNLITGPQVGVLSAASVIMFMIVSSRILGLIRQRVLAHYFVADELSLFFAAFRLPDLVFEVLVFGTFSSAFIPVFTKSIQEGKAKAWKTAGIVVNLGLIMFLGFSLLLGSGANFLYQIFAPGFTSGEREIIVQLTRILFAAQGFFVISYVLTGVLESLRRFLIPALAPLFYNLGIILGTILLTPKFGLTAPALGVVIGALSHFLIQLPLAKRLGFHFIPEFRITEEVRKIGKLATPRIIEVIFLQFSKMAELFFSSLISTASYTYYTFGNTLQLLPVGIFGTSIAKAALPTLSAQSDSKYEFKKTLLSALYQMIFLIAPLATILIVLRVPIVRLVYGTDIFEWESTVQTGYVLSAFAIGVVFQAASALLARSFYALHDTKTPVGISIVSIFIIVLLDFFFIKILAVDVWGLAAAFSIGTVFQSVILFYLINKKVMKESYTILIKPILKITIASFLSGFIMYFMLKIFDRSVWVKRLSFLGKFEATKYFPFEKFVLDTRYTVNLLILTFLVSLVGILSYFVLTLILKLDETKLFISYLKRFVFKHKVEPIPTKETETVAPTPTDTSV